MCPRPGARHGGPDRRARPAPACTYGRICSLSTPMDLLRFTPLKLADRVRLGLLALRAAASGTGSAGDLTIREWLTPGRRGGLSRRSGSRSCAASSATLADDISAVWFWKKLKSARRQPRRGQEQLAYYRGGFGRLADGMAGAMRKARRPRADRDGGDAVDRAGRPRDGAGDRARAPRGRRRHPHPRFRSSPTSSGRPRPRLAYLDRCAGCATWPTCASCWSWTAACRTPTGSTSTTPASPSSA